MNETEDKNIVLKKIIIPKLCFLKKINKSDKHLARLTKRKREKMQITNMRNKRGVITTNYMNITGMCPCLCKQDTPLGGYKQTK